MKDLYSFDATHAGALLSYNTICQTYSELFKELNLPYHKVLADAGSIGGHTSHEFHIPVPIGEDRLHVCTRCGFGYNAEVESKFLLIVGEYASTADGIQFSDCLEKGANETSTTHCPHSFQEVRGLEMGCYGIGMTRLLAAAVEYLSAAAFPNIPAEQVTELRWPSGLAPFSAALVLQKAQRAAQPVYELVDVYGGVSYEVTLSQMREAFQMRSFETSDLPQWNQNNRTRPKTQ
ncbi:unnamed protein product [Echinostoma caproni]|uniref:Proline--tRNA ligase n=1 Tax=Echinostoma caproni TaxID=27848 RepID=A0A183AXM4_9TREM|nr:unnamed protein product [Echinostoma caproni]